MSAPEVEWVLDQLGSVVDSVATDYTLQNGDSVELKRVDRDESRVYEGSQTLDMSTPIRDREGELQDAAYVGARLADVASDPVGTEYDHAREAVVGLRLEGLHHGKYGHVDPDGDEGVPWEELKQRVRNALLAQRTWPNAGRTDVSYTDLRLTNEAPQSAQYGDYYRWDVDVLFNGFEDI
ncbi:hypothetical protein BRC81_02970 [Halobacteriales archaeon QS_1_68_20]|nr:MAG: hypothetical protein BRC81_02970 [Halobacteriales archaeon QS_1_68_20]